MLTWAVLLERAKYLQRRLVYLGGGVAGLGIYGAGDIGSDIFKDYQGLRAAFVLLALAAGASIGWAWEPCARCVARIERHHLEHLRGVSTSPEEWLPGRIMLYNNLALILLIAAAGVLAAAAILSAL